MAGKNRASGRSETSGAREMPAVKTTIVGGRPPGCGKLLGVIPRGIEVLLKKSAVDPEFRSRLLEERAAAATSIGLRLDHAESEILNGVERGQLEAVIGNTKVEAGVRPAFLGQVAAVMLVALGASTAGCNRRSTPEPSSNAAPPTEESVVAPPAETSPQSPEDAPATIRPVPVAGIVVEMSPQAVPIESPIEVHAVDGIRIDRPVRPPEVPDEVRVVKGIRAVEPETKTPETKTPPPAATQKAVAPAEVKVMRGIRIDRPKEEVRAVHGVRPTPQPQPEDK